MPDEPTYANYRFVIGARPLAGGDPRSAGYLADAHALGLSAVTALECLDLYFIEGQLSETELGRLATTLLGDPVTQTATWGPVTAPARQAPGVIEVALRPGVTDPVAEQIVRAAGVLGLTGVVRAATGLRFLVQGADEPTLHLLARRLLANPTIQRYALGEIEPSFPHPAAGSGQVEVLPVRDLDEAGLLALSQQRRAALDLAEMQAIQAYYRQEGREPTDIEFEMIAQTWSEHCVHKTFRALIELRDSRSTLDAQRSTVINGLLKTYIRAATEAIAAPWVLSAFTDNAGIIDFDDEYEVSFKVETHNHPSAIEPFGGANTGTGGVIRDVLGVSAKPIAATDVLCFGPQDLPPEALPEGVLHPRRIQSGVVAGVQDYGNKIGLSTVNGAILYDPGYTANPLVYCGCVGLAPKGSHPRAPQPGDRVIVLGGRTGRDGLRGATFSSMTMDAQTGVVSGASVQIGDPITEKGLIEVILRARDQKLYHAVTDCGAGGLSSAVGEMASTGGAEIELTKAPLKYPGLAPWEIWLSEAQERMVLAAPPAALPALQALCDTFEVALTDIGAFTGSGRLVVRYARQVVLNLSNEFLHEGIPQRKLAAEIPAAATAAATAEPAAPPDPNAQLLAWLAAPNVASKAAVIRIYDHEVQGGTVVKPLTGVCNDGPSDACVLKPIGTAGMRGIVLSNGINPEYGKRDPYRMAVSVVDEAIRNAVAVGADPEHIALLDNFCWGDPRRPSTLGGLVEAARGCHDAALHYRTPFISGKDSLNNEYLGSDGQRHAIPPSLLISAIGLIEDVGRAATMDLKEPFNQVYLVGDLSTIANECATPGMPEQAPAVYRALHKAMQAGLVRACHDLSEGGLAVAAAEMCIGGRLGLRLNIRSAGELFGEVIGCLLVEVRPGDCPAFEAQLAGLPQQRLGQVTGVPGLHISLNGQTQIALTVAALVKAWQRGGGAA
jgi:phosphoribosylformylglycinamidine synthase